MDAKKISYADLVEVIRNLKPGNGAFYFFNNACELGNVALCQACIDAGIDVNVREKHSQNTLLMEIIIKNKVKIEIVEWLIKHGIDINAKDPREFTALSFACDIGNFELAKLLLENGAVIRDCDVRQSDLIIAIVSGQNQKIVKLLLESGFYKSKKYELEVALTSAIELGLTEIVRVLIEHGVPANSYFYAVPALHNAVESGNIDIVRLLLENGADVNAVRKDTATKYRGWYTALNIVEKDDSIYQLLVQNGGKVPTAEQLEQFEQWSHKMKACEAFDKLREIIDYS